MFRRGLKAILGIGILGLGGWTITEAYTSSSGARAVLNGKVATVRAPYPGYVSFQHFQRGSPVSRGEQLATLRLAPFRENNSEDVQTLMRARERVVAIQSQIAAMQPQIDELHKKSEEYRIAKVEQLESKISEANANIDAARAKERAAIAVRDRQQGLYSRGLTVKGSIESADQAVRAAELEGQAAEKHAMTLKTELSSARSGTFLVDGYNDASYSRQRADQLALRVSDLQAELQQNRGLIASMTGNPDADKTEASAADRAPPMNISAPVSGVIWSLVGDGQYVPAGDEIARVVDCSQLFVSVAVSQRGYGEVNEGARAFFRKDGSTENWPGTVTWVGVPDRELGKRLNTAVDSPVPNDARYSFLIALDPVQTPDKACQVGKPGQVSFQTDSLQDRAVRSIAGLANNDFGAFFGKLANASMATVDRVKEVVTRLGS